MSRKPDDPDRSRRRDDARASEKIGVETEHVAVARPPAKDSRRSGQSTEGPEVFENAVKAPTFERGGELRRFRAERLPSRLAAARGVRGHRSDDREAAVEHGGDEAVLERVVRRDGSADANARG